MSGKSEKKKHVFDYSKHVEPETDWNKVRFKIRFLEAEIDAKMKENDRLKVRELALLEALKEIAKLQTGWVVTKIVNDAIKVAEAIQGEQG